MKLTSYLYFSVFYQTRFRSLKIFKNYADVKFWTLIVKFILIIAIQIEMRLFLKFILKSTWPNELKIWIHILEAYRNSFLLITVQVTICYFFRKFSLFVYYFPLSWQQINWIKNVNSNEPRNKKYILLFMIFIIVTHFYMV